MSWFHKAFTEDYLNVCRDYLAAQVPLELRFLKKRLPVTPPAKILDLCCGHGRHSVPLAKKGFQVTGLDFNSKYLTEAREKAQEACVQLELVTGDMRKLPFAQESFDAVLSMYGSFGYLDNDQENLDVLREVHRVLTSSGVVMVDVLNSSWYQEHSDQSVVFEAAGQKVRETNRFDPQRKRSEVTHEFLCPESGMTVRSSHYSIRLYTAEEMTELLERAGFQVLNQWGDFVGTPAKATLGRLITLAQKGT